MKRTLKIAILLCLAAIVMLLMTSCDELLIKLRTGVETTMSDDGKPDDGKPDDGKPDDGKPDDDQPDNTPPDDGKIEDDTSNEDNPGEEPHVHTIEIIPAVEPTCIETGLTEGKRCSSCNEIIVKQTEIPVTEHTPELIPAVEPTCTEDGISEGMKCASCGKELAQRTTIPAGHKVFIDEAVAPTCTQTGLTEGKHCSVCDEIIVEQIEISITEHNYKYVVDDPTTTPIVVICTCTSCNDIHTQTVTPTDFTVTSKNRFQIGFTESTTDLVIPAIFEFNGVWYRVVRIDEKAFYNCSNIESVTMPNSVTSIGGYAFQGCTALVNVYINSLTSWLAIDFGESFDALYGSANPLFYAHNLYLEGELLTELVIPDGVTSIGNFAFISFGSFTSVTIPASVTCIDDFSFYGCTGLKSVTVDDNSQLATIGYRAFQYCYDLENVTFGANSQLASIGAYAFDNCYNLPSITIPNSVTIIDRSTFQFCSHLESIIFEGTIEQWNTIQKLTDWNFGTGKYTIYCVDGTIAKDGTITLN